MNIEEIYKQNKDKNEGYLSCDLSNFRICCKKIQQALDKNNLEEAVDEMCSFTGIFSEGTTVNYGQYRINTGSVYDRKFRVPKSDIVDSKTIIQNDFEYARNQIQACIEQNYCFGEFDITKEVLKLPHWCVDWRYYNKNTERFVKICRKVDADFNLKKAQTDYEHAYKADYNALDVYFSRYNQRCYLKFASLHDAIEAVGDLETEYGEYNNEDGTIWVDVPFSC